MDKDKIISEIKRLATENDGAAPGILAFEKATGITRAKWRGKYWINWSEALSEAGLTPNNPNEAHSTDFLLLSLAQLTRKLGKFPTYAHLRMERRNNPEFPTHQVFNRLGLAQERIELVRAYISGKDEFKDIASLLPSPSEITNENEDSSSNTKDGFVYLGMLKIGAQKRYKIGKTNLVERRNAELSLQLPEKLELVHYIKTDDISGIEAYWHKRFVEKNTNGEWFDLTANDVRAFKLRKFM